MPLRRGTGQFYGWDGGCLFIGRHERELPLHAHHAIQLVVASEGEHLVRGEEGGAWTNYSIAAIASQQSHALNVTAAPCGAVIFIEPETRAGRAIAQRIGSRGIAEVGSPELRVLTDRMFAARREGQEVDLLAHARSVTAGVASGVEPAQVTDDRVIRAIEVIGARLDRSITLEEVAAEVFLSPGRFRHLFVEQTGMGLRPYILWRRFLLVWSYGMQGRSFSEAAHAAGFADAAHMTRTCVRNFGFSPSSIQLEPLRPSPD